MPGRSKRGVCSSFPLLAAAAILRLRFAQGAKRLTIEGANIFDHNGAPFMGHGVNWGKVRAVYSQIGPHMYSYI